MKQFGSSGRLRCAGIICTFLILATQLSPFLGDYREKKDNRRSNTYNLAGTTLAETPPALTGAAMAYDSESDRIILFGGSYDESGLSNETWIYDFNTNTWTNMIPLYSPTARSGHHMVYDSQSDLCIMFGMSDYEYPMCAFDFWTYDLNSNTWTEMSSVMYFLSILSRPQYGMVYDSKADLVVLVIYDETWTYDVDIDTLENTTIAGHPELHYTPKMAYDENSGLTLLYSINPYGRHDTWVYNTTSNAWTEMRPERNPPCAERGSATFDSKADRMILFTTRISAFSEISETWSYSYETDEWSERAPMIQPTPREASCMAYDSESDKTILFSGSNGYADTWAYSYEGNTWTYMAWRVHEEAFCFVAYGNTKGNSDESVSPIHGDIVNLYLGHDPDFIIHSGDMVTWGSLVYQWDYFNESISYLRALKIPLYCAPGDHDQLTPELNSSDYSLSAYQDFFDYSDVVDQPGETELYYSFNANGIHFISLNTADEWTDCNYTCPEAQMEWLEADLAAGHEFIIVFFHHPAWSIRGDSPEQRTQVESVRDAYHPVFVEHGVDLVFNGHNTLYYRTIRDGICYVVTGGGGATLDEIQIEGTDWRTGDVGFSEYHYCVAEVTNGTLNMGVFLLNGSIADTFSLAIPMPPDPTLMIVISSVTVVTAIVIVILVIGKKEEL